MDITTAHSGSWFAGIRRISFAAALIVVVAAPLSAQTWQVIGVPNTSCDIVGCLVNLPGVAAAAPSYDWGAVMAGGRDVGVRASVVSEDVYQGLLVSMHAVPEPATVGLLGFGLLALAGISRRRNV